MKSKEEVESSLTAAIEVYNRRTMYAMSNVDMDDPLSRKKIGVIVKANINMMSAFRDVITDCFDDTENEN
jgi:hypothetical protein